MLRCYVQVQNSHILLQCSDQIVGQRTNRSRSIQNCTANERKRLYT